jgi:hypothetical protein
MVLGQASGGASATVDIGRLGAALQRPADLPSAWQAYNYLENHDLQLDEPGEGHRQPRVVRLADPGDARSWYARSRSRVAMGLLLTVPGVPALFMGQEFLEDKLWSDSPRRSDRMIWWDGIEGGDADMADFHRCTRDLVHLRRALPALRADRLHVFHVNPEARVLAFHRWVPGEGRDVVVVLSLREATFYDHSYQLEFRCRDTGGRSTTAIATTPSPIPGRRATRGELPRTDRRWMTSHTPPASPSRPPASWFSPTGEAGSGEPEPTARPPGPPAVHRRAGGAFPVNGLRHISAAAVRRSPRAA